MEKRRVPLVKIDADKMLVLAEGKIRDLEAQLAEAVECLKVYSRHDQVGQLAHHALEHLKKWGHS